MSTLKSYWRWATCDALLYDVWCLICHVWCVVMWSMICYMPHVMCSSLMYDIPCTICYFSIIEYIIWCTCWYLRNIYQESMSCLGFSESEQMIGTGRVTLFSKLLMKPILRYLMTCIPDLYVSLLVFNSSFIIYLMTL